MSETSSMSNAQRLKQEVDEKLDVLSHVKTNLSDLQDFITKPSINSLDELDLAHNGTATDEYSLPGSFITTDTLKDYFKHVVSESFRQMGQGGYENQLQLFLTRLDRLGAAVVPLNTMNYGFTFITRPRLNLTSANLIQNPILATLRTTNKASVAFMIRALLDTRLSMGADLIIDGKYESGALRNTEVDEFGQLCMDSGLIDVNNPFFVPLCNGLKGISGFPDFNIETETSEGDFHNGDFTFAKGSDMNNRTQELSLEFRDTQGSIILSCFYYWCLYMALQAKGVVMAYPDDIYQQRLNYTVSIYRFVTDPTRTQILWWAKATGCFPKSVPIGALFNVSQGEETISSARDFTIPFTANDVKVNDPGILADFNALVQRYNPGLPAGDYAPLELPGERMRPDLNFTGIPFIVTPGSDGADPNETGIRLVWYTTARYLATTGITKFKFHPTTGEYLGSEAGDGWDSVAEIVYNEKLNRLNQVLSMIENSSTADTESRELLANADANTDIVY